MKTAIAARSKTQALRQLRTTAKYLNIKKKIMFEKLI